MIARRAKLEDLWWASPEVLGIAARMLEIDDRLGLTPKGLAALRWRIREEEEAATPDLAVVVDASRWQKWA